MCDKGHEWEETPRHRIQNATNCPYCSNHRILEGYNDLATTTPELLKEWDSVKNVIQPTEVGSGSAQKVWWKCDKGHEWEARVVDRTYYKTDCPYCVRARDSSKPEKELLQYLKKTQLNIIPNDRSVLNGRGLDLYVPEKHIAIEYNGLYWHSEATGKEKEYHYQKWVECRNKGIQLITVWEDDWLRNPELVKTMLAYKLGLQQGNRVYGRNTRIVPITAPEALLFLNQHHIQGSIAGSIRVGLEEKTTGTLVVVMVFKHETPTTLNLLRYATSASVIGGFSKLLQYVAREYTPASIVTFSDHMVSNSGLYEKNGFVAVKN